jgi:hypothetical protein
MSLKTRYHILLLLSALPVCSFAQYPVIPDSLKAVAAQREQLEQLRSEKLWQQAQARMAEEGRPYITDAAKPEDLPQAKIPAFPGAEGGGAYTAGGREGVLWWLPA